MRTARKPAEDGFLDAEAMDLSDAISPDHPGLAVSGLFRFTSAILGHASAERLGTRVVRAACRTLVAAFPAMILAAYALTKDISASFMPPFVGSLAFFTALGALEFLRLPQREAPRLTVLGPTVSVPSAMRRHVTLAAFFASLAVPALSALLVDVAPAPWIDRALSDWELRGIATVHVLLYASMTAWCVAAVDLILRLGFWLDMLAARARAFPEAVDAALREDGDGQDEGSTRPPAPGDGDGGRRGSRVAARIAGDFEHLDGMSAAVNAIFRAPFVAVFAAGLTLALHCILEALRWDRVDGEAVLTTVYAALTVLALLGFVVLGAGPGDAWETARGQTLRPARVLWLVESMGKDRADSLSGSLRSSQLGLELITGVTTTSTIVQLAAYVALAVLIKSLERAMAKMSAKALQIRPGKTARG